MGKKNQTKGSQVEHDAWAWAENTDDQSITADNVATAYRTNAKSCRLHYCRRNCKSNPRCVNAIGEGKWFQEIKDHLWYEVEDPEKERRQPGTFAGLKNLGATCYVNTFLQVWFHNNEIRRAVFEWQEETNEENLVKLSIPYENLVAEMRTDELERLIEPKTPCGHLQAVFAQLMFSERRYIDPTPFINSLGLDAAQQQDAQEFSKLFMSLLEDTLSQQNSPERNFIQHQFQGQYQYVTRCNGCKSESRRPSQFYELDLNIKGHRNLQDCIGEFLQEEKLEGDNQYACSNCQSKQNAARSIRLQSLPPVFNIQLLRFVFDRKTGHKKKLNTFIEFAEQLDMSKYLEKEEGTVMYDLTAVLIHRGPSAYSGHYIAHIRDRKSRDWYKFNDEEVQRMGGKKLELGNEDELEGTPKSASKQRPKTTKGFHASRNAYMLVYAARKVPADSPCTATNSTASTEEYDTISTCSDSSTSSRKSEPKLKVTDLPLKMQKFLEQDVKKFEQWLLQMVDMRKSSVQTGRARQDAVKEMFAKLPWKDGEEFDWISTYWLSHYIGTEYTNKITPIDNKELVCIHSKMDPEKVPKAKCISKIAADELYLLHEGGPRLTSTSLCEACVRLRARVIRMRSRIAEDQREISAFLRTKAVPTELSDWYWVGKLSLRSWKRYATEQLQMMESLQRSEQQIMDVKQDSKSEETKPTRDALDTRLLQSPLANSNSDVPNSGDTQVSEKEKTTLGKTENLEDSTSKSLENATPQISEALANSAIKKSEGLGNSIMPQRSVNGGHTNGLQFNEDAQCLPHDNMVIEDSVRRLVPKHIWDRLKYYFPDAPEYRGDTAPCLQCLAALDEEERIKAENKASATAQKLDLHNLYAEKSRPNWNGPHTQLYVLSADFLNAWRRFLRDPVKHSRPKNVSNRSVLCDHGGFLHDPATLTIDARANYLCLVTPDELTILRQHVDVDVDICVFRVTEESGHVTFIVQPEICVECQNARNVDFSRTQGTYTNAAIYIRKTLPEELIEKGKSWQSDVTLTSGTGDDSSNLDSADPEFVNENGKRKLAVPNASDKAARLDDSHVRRSSRHRKCPGEKKITVNSTDTLRDLKIKVLELFSVAPFDQNISHNGKLLTDDKRTLSSLQVRPGETLYLKEDEPTEDPTFLDDPTGTGQEEGFKGTSLLSR